MAEYAPPALQAMFATVRAAIPSAQLGGILGDRAHTYGYHRGRRHVSSGDYSVQREDDRVGDPDAASALDITLPASQMRLVTGRLIRATKARDPRLRPVREFFGTVNGRNVTGLDVRDQRWVTSDSSHLWHVHVSVHRRWATDHAALQQVAGVLIGTPPPSRTPLKAAPRKDDDMTRSEVEEMIAQALRAYHLGGDWPPFTHAKHPLWVHDEKHGVSDRLTKLESRK